MISYDHHLLSETEQIEALIDVGSSKEEVRSSVLDFLSTEKKNKIINSRPREAFSPVWREIVKIEHKKEEIKEVSETNEI